MSALTTYIYSTASWLCLQATPLLLTPSLIISLLDSPPRSPTGLETYLSRSLALGLLFSAVQLLVLSGAVPPSESSAASTSTSGSASASSSATVDNNKLTTSPSSTTTISTTTIISITLVYHAVTAVYAYTQYLATGQTAFALNLVGSGGLAAFGFWCVLFGGGGHMSRRTGADKRTSGFPFRNAEAEKRKVGRGKNV